MERIDDLQFDGLKIIQETDGFCFGIDSILLAHFVYEDIGKKDITKVMDLGCGTGVLALLLSNRIHANKIIGIEKQEKIADIAVRNVKLNKLESHIEIVNEDILNIINKHSYAKSAKIIVTNPPYKKLGTGIHSDNSLKQLARFESSCDINKWMEACNQILDDGGYLYMVYRPERLNELFLAMIQNNVEPKEIRFVHSKIDEPSKLVLVKAVKGAKHFLKIDKPLIIYDNDGKYTEEIEKYYKE